MSSSLPETDAPQPRLRLTEARIFRDWSQQDVADRVGTTHVNVSRWERGVTKPNPYYRRKLCRLFGKTELELDLEIAREVPAPDPTPFPLASVPPPVPLVYPVAPDALYDPAIPLQPAVQLVGRDAELARIKQRLFTGGSVALTALNGLPGVGKTTLAITLAHDLELRKYFRDGILWAGLGPHPNMQGLQSRWGTLLGVPATEMATLSTSEAWASALCTAIGARHLLLVLDDIWNVEDVLACKVGGPHCAYLVTTRFPYIASHITVDGATAIQALNIDDSMALLRQLAPTVVERETARAQELVHAVGGLPLALTLLGNYLRKEGHSGQTRRISTALKRLEDAEVRLKISEPRGPVERHPSLPGSTSLSLQSVIAVTDQQLSEAARAAFYALAAFPPRPDSFSEEAALVVAACEFETLDLLSDAGLLESSGSDRYALHQIIADYARLQLHEETPFERLIDYATDFIDVHKTDYELLELESNCILAALEAASRLNKRSELVRGVIGFAPFLLVRASYQLAEQLLQRAQTAAQQLADDYGLTSVLLYLGQIALRLGNYAQAESSYQQGLTLARELNDPERISALLTDLGTVAWKRGEYAQAEAYLQEGLQLARQIDHRERICGLLEALGSVAGVRGDYSQSEAFLQESLVLAHEIGDRERICTLLINLGATFGEQGDYIKAVEYFQEGLIIARQIGHSEWISVLLGNLGDAAGELGNYDEAEAYFQEGLILTRKIEHREWISALLINLGVVTRKKGDYPQAEGYFEESLTLARQLGRPEIITHALYESGNLYLIREQPERAEKSFREMLQVIPEGDLELVALSQYGLARVALALNSHEEALQIGTVSANTLESIGHRTGPEVRHWLDSLSELDNLGT